MLAAAPRAPLGDRQGLAITLAESDYFTVRTITEVFRTRTLDSVARVFPAPVWWPGCGADFAVDAPPFHVSVQAVIVNHDPKDGEWSVVMTVPSGTLAGAKGGISVTMAEQVGGRGGAYQRDPWWREVVSRNKVVAPGGEGDRHIVAALRRGLREELGLEEEDYEPPLFLNAALEAEMFFVTFIFLVRTALSPPQLHRKWTSAPDHNESHEIALVPFAKSFDSNPPEAGCERVLSILAQREFNLDEYLLFPPGIAKRPGVGPRRWHPSSRMRLYVTACHFWYRLVRERVFFDHSTGHD